MGLLSEQLAELRVHATAAALTYHDSVVPASERVDLEASLTLHGDLRLVAVDVLEAAGLHASRVAGAAVGTVKRVKIEGEVEVERVMKTSAESASASSWAERAARLRAEATAQRERQAQSAAFVPTFGEWGVNG